MRAAISRWSMTTARGKRARASSSRKSTGDAMLYGGFATTVTAGPRTTPPSGPARAAPAAASASRASRRAPTGSALPARAERQIGLGVDAEAVVLAGAEPRRAGERDHGRVVGAELQARKDDGDAERGPGVGHARPEASV